MYFYWNVFLTFIRIGVRSLAGVNRTSTLMEEEIVTHRQWLKHDELEETIELAQSVPGIKSINTSIFIGQRIKGAPTAFLAMIGLTLPAFCIAMLFSILLIPFSEHSVLSSLFKGIRPAMVAIIAGYALNECKAIKINLTNVWIPVLVVALICILKVSPIFFLPVIGLGGFLYGRYVKPLTD